MFAAGSTGGRYYRVTATKKVSCPFVKNAVCGQTVAITCFKILQYDTGKPGR